jgi:bifunctional DNase/RNase
MRRNPVPASLLLILLWASLALSGESKPLKESKEVKVKTVTLDPSSQTPVVILEVVQDKTFLPIWVGSAEAASIAMELEQVALPRPNTHDLIRTILENLGASLHHITITDMKNNTYFARLSLKVKGQDIDVDSRPSDAIAVALRMKAPIYASSDVLAKTRQLPAGTPSGELRKTLGLQVQELNAELANLLNSSIKRGLLVSDVELGSTASGAGLQRGDIILRVNEQAVHSVAQIESHLKNAKQMRLEVSRKGKTLSLALDVPS